mgnify:CR=1 FL=1
MKKGLNLFFGESNSEILWVQFRKCGEYNSANNLFFGECNSEYNFYYYPESWVIPKKGHLSTVLI